MRTLPIDILLYDGAMLMDVAGPAQVFTNANRHSDRLHYRVNYLSMNGGRVRTDGEAVIDTLPARAATRRPMHTLIVPGADIGTLSKVLREKKLIEWIAANQRKLTRICSVCSGLALLAAGGLLAGRKAATHWRAASKLQQLFPDVEVDGDAIYIHDGKYWTSAGVSTGIDMSLALVAEDQGPPLAQSVASDLVLYMFRPGKQSQFAVPLHRQETFQATSLPTLISWLTDNLHRSLSVDHMAAACNLSVRTLHRRCQTEFNCSPAKLLKDLRLDKARELLLTGNRPLKSIASKLGFSDASSLVNAFKQKFGLSPGQYRLNHLPERQDTSLV